MMNVDAALEYAARGWAVLPLHNPEPLHMAVSGRGIIKGVFCSCSRGRDALECQAFAKHPRLQNGLLSASTNPDQIKEWWCKWPEAGIGVITGKPSGFVVVDLDTKSQGFETLVEVEKEHGALPATLVAITGGGGRHYFFEYFGEDLLPGGANVLGKGLDLRGDGNYICAVPTLHKSGNKYQWQDPDVKMAPLPEWIIKVLKNGRGEKSNGGGPITATPLAERLKDGNRNQGLFKELCALQGRGCLDVTIKTAAKSINRELCDPPLPDHEVEVILKSVLTRYPKNTPERAMTDLGNAERFHDRHGHSVRYCEQSGGWLLWSGKYWKIDEGSMVRTNAYDVARSILRDAADVEDKDARNQLIKWARSSESRRATDAMLEQVKPLCACSPSDWDRSPWLLNVNNGTIDLRTGKIRDHRRDDYLRKLIPVDFDPDAKAPNWFHFLCEIFENNFDIIQFVQRAVGYTLTGDTSMQALFFCYGGGANGKALALDTPIPTPAGWTTQGELKPGDSVFDENGNPCRVVGVTDTWYDRPCYRVAFSDGTSVIADKNHEWSVHNTRLHSDSLEIHTTDEISKTIIKRHRSIKGIDRVERQWNIPVAKSLQLPEANLPIDPYILGIWLGDGESAGARITASHNDCLTYCPEIERAGLYCRVKEITSTTSNIRISTTPNGVSRRNDSFVTILRDEGLLNNKHIPDGYLRSSHKQRLSLLQGLMDTDGTTSKNQAQCEYTSISKKLADGVLELVRSLGLRPTLLVGVATIYGKSVGPKYRVVFSAPVGIDIFKLPRKLDMYRTRKSKLVRQIISCEPTESVPVKCIKVDSASRLYLCGEAMIPTHNSTFIETLAELFADYGAKFPNSLLMRQKDETGNANPEVAGLAGVRFAHASEIERNSRMAESRVKDLTGGDSVTARFLYRGFFSFRPTHKLWMYGNDKPIIKGTDEGIWRRIFLIPFLYRIPEAKKKPDFRELMLIPELPGILNWAVEGCKWWQEDGYKLGAPGVVVDATKSYREEMDFFGEFIADRCVIGKDCTARANELYVSYTKWAQDNGDIRIMTSTGFGRELARRGFGKQHDRNGKIYSGIGLLDSSGQLTGLSVTG